MKHFPGTEIPCQMLSKSELAQMLRIHVSTLAKWRRNCEDQLVLVPGYNKYSKLLSPACVRIILHQNGLIRENSSES